MPSIFTGVRPVFTFADEGLIEYEKIAARRLGDILERLELGENANLQLNSSVYLPDDVAKISFKVMEGILEPIIIVDIDRQDPSQRLEREERDLPPQLQKEKRYYYSPSFWVGTTTVNMSKGSEGNNPNCGFFGYPPQSLIWAFEPPVGQDLSGDDIGFGNDGFYGYTNTVEHHPGLTSICGLPSWLDGKEDQPDANVNRELTIFNNTTYSRGSVLSDEGYFGDQNFGLLESILRSNSGMIAAEGPGCYQTTPLDALRPWGQNGRVGGFIEDEETLPPNYWLRSVFVFGAVRFAFDPDVEAEDPVSVSHTIPAIVTGELPGDNESGIATVTEMPQDQIFNLVLPGSYEINVFAMTFECECASADVRVRLVLGERITEIERLNGETSNVEYEAIIQVIDIEPNTIGGAYTCQQDLCRDASLGGHGICEDEGERGMLDSNGRGIWNQALYVNPFAGSWEIDAPSFRQPFFNTGSTCAQGTNGLPSDPTCQSCSFVPFVPNEGFGILNSGWNCVHGEFAGKRSVADTRAGVGFHLARVVGVEDPGGRLCHVQLVGNDGGAGQCGGPTYSYGRIFFATGIDPSIPLGTDLTTLPPPSGGFGTPGEIGGWQLGELVVVVGFAGGSCDPNSCSITSDERLLVSKLNAGGEDFTLPYWSQFGCSEGVAFKNFIEEVEEQSTISVGCQDGAAAAPVLVYVADGDTAGFFPAG